jgi:hypothetical protein
MSVSSTSFIMLVQCAATPPEPPEPPPPPLPPTPAELDAACDDELARELEWELVVDVAPPEPPVPPESGGAIPWVSELEQPPDSAMAEQLAARAATKIEAE